MPSSMECGVSAPLPRPLQIRPTHRVATTHRATAPPVYGRSTAAPQLARTSTSPQSVFSSLSLSTLNCRLSTLPKISLLLRLKFPIALSPPTHLFHYNLAHVQPPPTPHRRIPRHVCTGLLRRRRHLRRSIPPRRGRPQHLPHRRRTGPHLRGHVLGARPHLRRPFQSRH